MFLCHVSTDLLVQITRGIHTDVLLNYETVKYFGGEEHEGERYRDALREYQTLEYKVISKIAFVVSPPFLRNIASHSFPQFVEYCSEHSHRMFCISATLFTIDRPCQAFGLLIGSLIVASRVTQGQSDSGDFVLFITYLAQVMVSVSNVSIFD